MRKPKTKTTFIGNFLTQRLSITLQQKVFIFLFIIPFISVKSQILSPSVIASSGDSKVGANCILNWTLGQIADETYTKTTVILSQGFQQNFISTPVKMQEIKDVSGFLLYPNPVSDNVTIIFPKGNKDAYNMELYNSKGGLIWVKIVTPGTIYETINLTNHPSCIYWLRITNNTGKEIKTFKFVKL